MFLAKHPDDPSMLMADQSTGVRLRIRRAGSDEQLFDLPYGKTTIGSSPRCSVRIEQSGVSPIHLIVVRSPDSLTVRSWAKDSRLNGEPFQEATVRPGDCLTFASVSLEFEKTTCGTGRDVPDSPVAEAVERAGGPENEAEFPIAPPSELASAADVAGAGEPVTTNTTRRPRRKRISAMQSKSDELRRLEKRVEDLTHLLDGLLHERRSQPGNGSMVESADCSPVTTDNVSKLDLSQTQLVPKLAHLEREIESLQQQLRAANDTLAQAVQRSDALDLEQAQFTADRAIWNDQRAELQERLAQSDRRLSDSLLRIEQLEREFAAAQAHSADTVRSPMGLSADPAASSARNTPATDNLPPSEFDWAMTGKSRRSEPTFADLLEEPITEVAPAPSGVVPNEANWRSSRSDTTEPQSESSRTTNTAGARTDQLTAASTFDQPDADESDLDGDTSASADSSPTSSTASINEHSGSAASAPSAEPEDEFAPFAEFSIWNQGAGAQDSAAEGQGYEGPLNAGGTAFGTFSLPVEESAHTVPGPRVRHSLLCAELDEPDSAISPTAAHSPAQPASERAERPLAPQLQPSSPAPAIHEAPTNSFIERYAHLFADDEPVAEPAQPAPPPRSADDDTLMRKPRSMGSVATNTATTSDEEESIEQYMAKLMQRVRGERPYVAASQAPPVPPDNTAIIAEQIDEPEPSFADARGESPVLSKQDLTSLGTVRRKSTIVERSAHLEAFRALANETARRAISTHALEKHRRDAVTKAIVSTLAGMTSLFVILEAPEWLDLQCITACVSFLVAALWAAETYGQVAESFRAAAYDGPEELLEHLMDPFRPALPIDVEQ